jgi:hypothetical protein
MRHVHNSQHQHDQNSGAISGWCLMSIEQISFMNQQRDTSPLHQVHSAFVRFVLLRHRRHVIGISVYRFDSSVRGDASGQ